MCTYLYLNRYAVYLKLTQYCKSAVFQIKWLMCFKKRIWKFNSNSPIFPSHLNFGVYSGLDFHTFSAKIICKQHLGFLCIFKNVYINGIVLYETICNIFFFYLKLCIFCDPCMLWHTNLVNLVWLVCGLYCINGLWFFYPSLYRWTFGQVLVNFYCEVTPQ